MKPGTVFWDVDTQADFMSPDGKLYMSKAQAIVPNLQRLTSWAKAHGIVIVASTDAHSADDPEFKLYPPHCVVGTAGQKKLRETLLADHVVIPAHPVRLSPSFLQTEQIIVQKQTLDIFTNPNVEALLKLLGKPQIIVYGVATDICVVLVVRGLLDRGFQVKVVRDAIAALDDEAGRAALAEIQKRNGQLVTTDDVVSEARPRMAGD
jgi:nicotinamidase/pyrazinamidase